MTTNNKSKQQRLAKQFQDLHKNSELLVLPNAWDAGSAVVFEKSGCKAVGTTSAGIAYSLGYPDCEIITLDDLLYTSERIAQRLTVPLSVDIERGFADTPEDILETVTKVINLGAVGINIEDGIPETNQLNDFSEQCELIAKIVTLKETLDINFCINARTDVYWLAQEHHKGSQQDRESQHFDEAVKRSNAYLNAGADCAFVPGVLSTQQIKDLVQEIDGAINIIATPKCPSLPELESMGVARLSLGSGPARAAYGLTKQVADELVQHKALSQNLGLAMPYEDANALFDF